MIFIVLDDPEFRSGTNITKIENTSILLNLEKAIQITIDYESKSSMILTEQNVTYFLSKVQTLELIKILSEEKTIRVTNTNKIINKLGESENLETKD